MVLELAASTQLFLFPVMCAHYTRCWLRFPMCAMYVTSLMYHVTESGSWLLIDLAASQVCAALVLYHVTLRYRGTYALLLLNNVGACYTISCLLHHFCSEWWVVAHMYFHFWAAGTWLVSIHI